MLCSEWSLVKREPYKKTVTPLYCNCWHCEECAPRRKARLIAEAQAGNPNIFITLTSRRIEGHSPDAAARKLAWAWRIVRGEYLKAHGKKSLPFLAVFERTKKGWPHLHIVGRAKWVDQKWLSGRMGALIGAPFVWVERLTSKDKVANYITKYIGKNPERFEGTKRYWRSLDYLHPSNGSDSIDEPVPVAWSILRWSWRTIARGWAWEGWEVEEGWNQAVATLEVPP